jgi:hypothetical protein
LNKIDRQGQAHVLCGTNRAMKTEAGSMSPGACPMENVEKPMPSVHGWLDQ